VSSPTGKARRMRPSRTSLCIHLRSEPPRPTDKIAPDGAATIDVMDSNKGSVPCASKSGSKILSPDIPLWAAAEVSPGHHSSSATRDRLDQFGSGTGRSRLRDAAVVEERLSPNEQRVAVGRASRLDPLLPVVEVAAILNVSARTVRRLIASAAIPAVSIGRSVRLRPRDVEQLIASGCACDD
jgi:excisionase family DNA binding protein